MKNLTLVISLLLLSNLSLHSQSSLLVVDLTSSLTITNGTILKKNVAAASMDAFPFSIKNIGTGTKSYKLTRFYDVRNIIAPGDSSYVTFQFCGSHFAPMTSTSTCSVTLTANQTDVSSVSELNEASAVGRTDVRWRIFEVSNPSTDFTEFTLRYNDPTGIENINESIASVSEIFPCPANSKASITIDALKQTSNISLVITNSLGAIVSSQICNLIKGTNNLSIDANHLQSGIYFITLTSSDFKIQRKLIIEK